MVVGEIRKCCAKYHGKTPSTYFLPSGIHSDFVFVETHGGNALLIILLYLLSGISLNLKFFMVAQNGTLGNCSPSLFNFISLLSIISSGFHDLGGGVGRGREHDNHTQLCSLLDQGSLRRTQQQQYFTTSMNEPLLIINYEEVLGK